MKKGYGWSGKVVVLSLCWVLAFAHMAATGQYELLTPPVDQSQWLAG